MQAGKASEKKSVIAHRGASAYAPEHTLEAYRLAIRQGADFVEQDLQMSRDGILVCLHDLTLERTTNVEEVFPDRFRKGDADVRRWFVHDFTVAELRQLDAGSWFGSAFAGARIPTFQEAIDEVRGHAGLFPELKDPEAHAGAGLDMEEALRDILEKNHFSGTAPDPSTPIRVQSFSAASLERLSKMDTGLPLVLLVEPDGEPQWLTEEGLRRVRQFASGIGPAKALVAADPGLVTRAHRLGLTVTPWTFRASSVGRGFADVTREMRHFFYGLDVDALFTDNPDKAPREP